MAEINPQGYFTQDPVLGGGTGEYKYLLDPMDPAGAYKALLSGALYPSDVNNYENITSSSPLTSGGPFNLLPTAEGAVTLGVGAINPLFGLLTRGAISGRNAEALETLANQGILQVVTPAEKSSGFRKFMGYDYSPGTGEYRLSPEVEQAIQSSGGTPKEYFESQYQEKYGDASALAKYLDQIAYTTKGEFFQTDLFGNPTAWSKYVDRSGKIRPDALENWKKYGAEDKLGVLKYFQKKDQGTQAGTTDQGTGSGGGYIGAPMETQQTGGGGISDLSTNKEPFRSDYSNRRNYVPDNPLQAAEKAGLGSYESKVAENVARNIRTTGSSGYKKGIGFTKGR